MTMKMPGKLLIWALQLALFVVAVPGFAQNQNGTVRGVVLDQQGGVVSNADVTATNENTGASRNTQTSTAGAYIFPDLMVGSYTVKVDATGFAGYVRRGVQVLGAQVTDVTANLVLGTTTTEVRVGADVIQTESSQLSSAFEGRPVTEVPIATGGNLSVLNLAILLPNTTAALGGTSGTAGAVGGLRGRQNNFSIDGVDNNDPTVTAAVQQVIPDAVQEFTVNQNVFSAEYGRGSGGQFDVITKTGTNQLHFGTWLYNGNRAYDATDNQEQADILAGVRKGKRRYDFNRAGGDMGGPILKNKLFLYGAYEYDDLNQQATAPSGLSPTAAGLATLNILAVDPQVKNLLAQFPVAPAQTTNVAVDGQAIPVGSVNSIAPSYTRSQNYIQSGD